MLFYVSKRGKEVAKATLGETKEHRYRLDDLVSGRVAGSLMEARGILPLSSAKISSYVDESCTRAGEGRGDGDARARAHTQSRWSLAARTCVCGFQHAWAMLWHATRPLRVRNRRWRRGGEKGTGGEIQKGGTGANCRQYNRRVFCPCMREEHT